MSVERMDEAGFTLVEVLVALVVAALLLGIAMNGASLARKGEQRAFERRAAVRLADARIAEALHLGFAGPDLREGDLGTLHWRTRRTVLATDHRGLLALTEWRVEVSGISGSPLDFEARRLLPVPHR
jgi:prepilin-type N-terminal cleavage/methylation domain-containing protein